MCFNSASKSRSLFFLGGCLRGGGGFLNQQLKTQNKQQIMKRIISSFLSWMMKYWPKQNFQILRCAFSSLINCCIELLMRYPFLISFFYLEEKKWFESKYEELFLLSYCKRVLANYHTTKLLYEKIQILRRLFVDKHRGGGDYCENIS